jgi:rhodanese-related sulfurtransferase
VDLYRYDESWERSPVVLFTQFYEIPSTIPPQGFLSSIVLRPQRYVIDLRTASDFDDWHLPGSVNLPLQSLDSCTMCPFSNSAVLEAQWHELEALFTDAKVVAPLHEQHINVLVICYTGNTARVATSVLRAKGIEADNLRGGYKALYDNGLWGEPASAGANMINIRGNTPVAVQSN